MKKILVAVLMWPLLVLAQSYPSPTLQNLTVLGSLTGTGIIGLPTLAAQAANTVVANVTGSSASPTAFPMPSCSGANNALRWTAGTGFTCASAIALTSGNLSQFAATTSAQLAGVISDETGTGALVFGTNPTLAGFTTTAAATFGASANLSYSTPALNINDTSAAATARTSYQSNGTNVWALVSNSPSGNFQVNRYVSGTLTDQPISINNSTGSVTMPDGAVITGGSHNNAPIGNVTPSTGAFTTLSASSTISGTGFSTYLASPPAIGGTTAAAGTFTTLTTTSSINGVAVATCKNAAGDGAIIQAAVNTGKPVMIVGTCVMDSSVTISTPGQEIFGQGRHQTILNQSSVLSTGTFICSTGEPGPNFHDFAIQFTQPDTSTRASLTAYNPAFYCRNSPRSRFANLYIQAAMVAFDLQGNSGGSYLLNDEVSAFNAILILDGSLDTVRVDNLQGYNFGLTTNQLVIYRQSAAPTSSCSVFTGTVGICSGRMDDLKVKDSLFISGGPQIYFYAGTGGPGGTSWSTGPTFGSIEGTSFDTYWGIDSEGAGAIVRATGSYFNQAAGYSNMLVNNGTVSCSGCSFVVDANPAITIGSSGSVILSGGYAQLVTGNSFITNNGNLLLTGMMFQNGSTYNTGVITCPSALSCTVVGNALPNSVTSATNFINFTGTKLSTGNYGATNWGSL